MTPEQYRISTKRTRRILDTNGQKLNAALGLGEAGELQNLIKKELFHDHPIKDEDILDEAGDMLYYIDWVLDLYGWEMEAAFDHNSAKLAKRYPEGFSAERSINRE